jgi:uncharacterized protein (DUF2236 family)
VTGPTSGPSRPDASRPGPQWPVEGAFDRTSILRRVGGEPVMFLGAQRALLLQIAHPGVGQAVDEHSSFREVPVRRLWATADAMVAMVWGRPDEAAAAHRRIMALHDHIHGDLPATPTTPPGRYSAHDPEAVRWVWSTLVDTSVVVHERWLGPLAPTEREALLADWRRFGEYFGLQRTGLPDDWEMFEARYRAEVDALVVGRAALVVSRSILEPPLWFVPRAVKRAYGLIAAALLPPALRDQYRIVWGHDHDAAVATLDDTIRTAWAHAPDWRRDLPYAYLAVRRPVLAIAGMALGSRQRALDVAGHAEARWADAGQPG